MSRRYTGAACEACTSGWVLSQGQCIPYTPLKYTPLLWAQHLAALVVPAPAPAPGLVPAPAPEAESAHAPGPVPVAGPDFAISPSLAADNGAGEQPTAPVPAPGADAEGGLAGTESVQGDALPPVAVTNDGEF